jgi:hypothetical protein
LLERVLWVAWNKASAHREAVANDANLPELSTEDVVPVELNWDRINKSLRSKRFDSLTAAYTGYQANIARAVLERNGLV